MTSCCSLVPVRLRESDSKSVDAWRRAPDTERDSKDKSTFERDRDNRDTRESRDLRDNRDVRDSRDGRDRDGRDVRDSKDNRDVRDGRDMRDSRDRVGHDRETRDRGYDRDRGFDRFERDRDRDRDRTGYERERGFDRDRDRGSSSVSTAQGIVFVLSGCRLRGPNLALSVFHTTIMLHNGRVPAAALPFLSVLHHSQSFIFPALPHRLLHNH